VKLRLLWVGKTQEAWVRTGIEEYAGRVRRYLPFAIGEAKEEKGAHSAVGREAEGQRLEKLIPKGGRLILLDERGDRLSSPEFATLVGRERDSGTAELVFAIGGAYGFSDSIRAKAVRSIALSPMTFTHQMVRVIFLEQLYRALTILNNEPYHH
jgi:23S rRNA (pseudouridine1915-N3)-methyltransferase